MSKLQIWTLDEYYKNMKDFFLSQGEDKVIKILSPGVLGGAYQYWIKPSLMPFDKFSDIYWNFEPLMQRWFDSRDEMVSELKDIKDASGFVLRWLFRDGEIVYQVFSVCKDVVGFVNDYKNVKSEEYLMGFKMDPFVYTAKLPLRKGSGGEEYIDDKSPDLMIDSNYRVFWEEITPDQFLKEEALFMDKNKHDSYKDDLLNIGFEMNKETEEFFKKHTDFKY